MDIDEILNNLQNQIQDLEDMKAVIIELQEETRGLISGVSMWFEQHADELPGVE